MKRNKALLLFIALLLPLCIFLFLKWFGKNKFEVKPLYVTDLPLAGTDCGGVVIPYTVPDSVVSQLNFSNDSLVLISFGRLSAEASHQLKRVHEKFYEEKIHQHNFSQTDDQTLELKKCIFFLREPFDIVLVDRRGRIRGQYVSSSREEMDRVQTEIAIILGKY